MSEPQTIGDLFAAPRRTGTHAEHRFVSAPSGRYSYATFCRDCGLRKPDFWHCNILAAPQEPTLCEPDKYRPGWIITMGIGYITREEIKSLPNTQD